MAQVAHIKAWWLWHHAPTLGPKTWLRWLAHGIAPRTTLQWSWSQAHAQGVSRATFAFWHNKHHEAWEQVQTWLQASTSHHVVVFHDSDYPPLLREIADPPCLLYVRGKRAVLRQKQCAVVGSRRPTGAVMRQVTPLVRALVAHQMSVCSGLALGVDGMAHQAALMAQGNTVAVLGCGVDVCYPKRHQTLAADIVSHGALVSEMLLGTPVAAWQFPKRNRIISGMSWATFIVEASENSGSMITAHLAMRQNREVVVLPSSIDNVHARGGLRLIQEGAMLLADWSDLAALFAWSSMVFPEAEMVMDRERFDVLHMIGDAPTPLDVVQDHLSWPMARFLSVLSQLKMDRWVLETPHGLVRLVALPKQRPN